jgi:hypothetical protein
VLIQVVPRSVVPPRRPRVGVPCRVLHIPEACPGMERQGQADGPGTAPSLLGPDLTLEGYGRAILALARHATMAVGESR